MRGFDVYKQLASMNLFMLDLDGTFYLGDNLIEGSLDFIKKLRTINKQFIFVTNNSSKTPLQYVEKLRHMGLEIDKDRVITSGSATIDYLHTYYKNKKVYLLGNDSLKQQFIEEGVVLSETTPDIVVTAYDTTLNYIKLCHVCEYIRDGLPFLSTHADLNCPTENGFIPDLGSFNALIEASTGRSPDIVIGKPNQPIVNYVLKKYNLKNTEVAMVGDRLYTDILLGIKNDIVSILVLSGETKESDIYSTKIHPTIITNSLYTLMELL